MDALFSRNYTAYHAISYVTLFGAPDIPLYRAADTTIAYLHFRPANSECHSQDFGGLVPGTGVNNSEKYRRYIFADGDYEVPLRLFDRAPQ